MFAFALVLGFVPVFFGTAHAADFCDLGGGGYSDSFDLGGGGYADSYCDYGCYTDQYDIQDTFIDEYDVKYSYTDSYTDVYDSYSSPSCFSCSTPQSFASAPPVQVRNPGFPSFPSYP